MKLGVVLAFVAGVALTVWLVLHIGFGSVLEAVAGVGWWGFAAVCLSGLVMEVLSGLAYWALVPGKAPWTAFVVSRQLRDSVGDVLPFTQFAGMLAAARVVVLRGAEAPRAFAGLVVDITAEFVSQIGFIVVGLLLGWAVLRANPVMKPYVDAVMIGTAVLIPGAAAFVVLQQKGSVFVERIAERFLPAAVRHTEAFTRALHGLYNSPGRLAAATLCHFFNWIVSGVWLWIIISLAGAKISLADAIVMQSLLEALRSAAVIVPSSIGVQEAGLAMLAPVFGLGPEIGLAASLLRRARDLAIGVPVLLAWQLVEGRRALKQA